MEDIIRQLDRYRSAIAEEQPSNAQELEEFRIRYMGSRGVLKNLFAALREVPAEQKKPVGQLLNEFRKNVEQRYAQASRELSFAEDGQAAEEDRTLPAEPHRLGSRHPVSIIRKRIAGIFERLGFTIAEGPEIEDDWHNFTALNMPADHPARDMQDTFYISVNPDRVLRTHTSSVQVRVMEQGVLPIRIICPGRVFRNETISARAHCFFHQVEGLYIDEQVSFADLKQTLYFFVKQMFGEETAVRFRPSFFPFTEPSAEMDISCLICGGKGCAVCKQTGWVEILGCGMVHPKVLENCGIDSGRYTGFAFGMGVERIAMLKYQIRDLRLFSANDVRFLEQFRGAG
jgi:phenylalanyl-tRNA synthetase alpha chain